MRALVIGGTGPTGPHLVTGLLDRGYEVSILHRGTHEVAGMPDVEHIHCDPHFEEPLTDALAERRFDLVLATYGRTRIVARVLAGRCDRFIGVGGVPVYLGKMDPELTATYGLPLLVTEDAPLADTDDRSSRVARRLAETERTVFRLHDEGAFEATWFRYTGIYGPRNPTPWEWSVVKRVRDGRPFIILPDGGLRIRSRTAAANAAHCVLLAVDRPEVAIGEAFNCADDDQYTLWQWVELVQAACEGDLQMVSMPAELAWPGLAMLSARGAGTPHTLVDTSKAKHLLGYHDQVKASDAIAASVAWYLENPVTPESHPNFTDAFDYPAEDRLVEAYTDLTARILREAPPPVAYRHSYAHPNQPGVRDARGR